MFHIAEQAAQGSSIDPTLLALLSIFGGALIAAIAGLVGAWIQARREHRVWLREKRYEAYVTAKIYMREVHRQVTNLKGARDSGDKQRREEATKQIAALEDKLSETTGALMILSPAKVAIAVGNLSTAIFEGKQSDVNAAERDFVKAMQKSLRIRD